MPPSTPAPPPDPTSGQKAEARRLWSWREAICADAATGPQHLSDATKLVALRLSFHYDLTKRHVWTPQDQLARECSVHENTVQRARAQLVNRGALVVLVAPQRARAARYALGDPQQWHTAPGASLPTVEAPPVVSQAEIGTPSAPDDTPPWLQWDTTADGMGHPTGCVSSSLSFPERGEERGTTDQGEPSDPPSADAEPVVDDLVAFMGHKRHMRDSRRAP